MRSRVWEQRVSKCMVHARETYGLPIVSELMSADKIDEFVEHVDLIQIGARNMQNFDLLKAVGRINKPVLLKRGLANTIEEWIMAAEYIMSEAMKTSFSVSVVSVPLKRIHETHWISV